MEAREGEVKRRSLKGFFLGGVWMLWNCIKEGGVFSYKTYCKALTLIDLEYFCQDYLPAQA